MSFLLSIDPGLSSGITLWEYDDAPARRVFAWQFPRGLDGFITWFQFHTYKFIEGPLIWDFQGNLNDYRNEPWDQLDNEVGGELTTVISEKFVPLSGGGFSQTLDSVEPLRIEGAMVALEMIEDYTPQSIHWQRASEQYWVTGANKAEKRKKQKQWLKDHGLYLVGKDVNAPDAEDVISSSFHAIQWLKKNHKPSRLEWFGDTE